MVNFSKFFNLFIAVKTVLQLALKLGKVPVIVKDGPGFLVNRVLGAYLSEAGRMLTEGVDVQYVDKIILNWGMPMGPFRLMDEVIFLLKNLFY